MAVSRLARRARLHDEVEEGRSQSGSPPSGWLDTLIGRTLVTLVGPSSRVA